ncbi:unnamed protein product, partial [Prorocentrum cordatum]
MPHHVAGIWKSSKALARRDAAERALQLYAKAGGETAGEEDDTSPLAAADRLRDEQPWHVALTPEDVVFSVPIPRRFVAPRPAALTGRALGCPPPGERVRQPPPEDSLPRPLLALDELLPRRGPAALPRAPPGAGAPAGL